MADIIITNGIVVTMDPQRRVIENGAVAIEKDRIVAVGTTDEITAAYQAATIIDAKNKIVMPGLIDGHAHAGHGMIKTMGGGNSEQWYDACHARLHGGVDAGILARRGPSRGARAAALRRDDRAYRCSGAATRFCAPTIRSTATPIAKAFAKSEPAPSSPSGPTRPPHPRTYARIENGTATEYPGRLSRSSTKPASN